MNCIFCKIIAGQAPSRQVYQDEQATAFWDIHPVAPVHILIVPNLHIASVNDVAWQDEQLLGHLFTVAREIAAAQGVDQTGYRLIVNTGPYAGQGVFHIHLHLIAGKRLKILSGLV